MNVNVRKFRIWLALWLEVQPLAVPVAKFWSSLPWSKQHLCVASLAGWFDGWPWELFLSTSLEVVYIASLCIFLKSYKQLNFLDWAKIIVHATILIPSQGLSLLWIGGFSVGVALSHYHSWLSLSTPGKLWPLMDGIMHMVTFRAACCLRFIILNICFQITFVCLLSATFIIKWW